MFDIIVRSPEHKELVNRLTSWHSGHDHRDILFHVLANQYFIISKLETLMDKATFIQEIADLKTGLSSLGDEIDTVSGKVDTLEQTINNAPAGAIPDDVSAAFDDLKGVFTGVKTKLDTLSTKADNLPATPPVDGGTGTATT